MGKKHFSMTTRRLRGFWCGGLLLALSCGQVNEDGGKVEAETAGGAGETDTEDSSTESGDSSGDSGPCEKDADCDDGEYCNGKEACDAEDRDSDARGCVAGEEPCGSSSCLEEEEACGCEQPDQDNDGHDSEPCGGEDCDDQDAERYPGNPEVCDADDHDEDCDETSYGFRDQDDDGDPDDQCCNEALDGPPNCGSDCDDQDPVKYQNNSETCDDIDNDCDELIDESPDSDEPDGLKQIYTEDVDGDGYGSEATDAEQRSSCKAPSGFALSASDCDDSLSEVNPAAYDSCEDEIDNDCSTVPNDPVGGCACEGNVSQTCGDGGAGLLGKCATFERQCNNGSWDDCPLKPNTQDEVCDDLGEDEDCDGLVDEADAEDPSTEVAGSAKQTYYLDRDGDDYPDLTSHEQFCPDYEAAGFITDENPQDCRDVALGTDPLSASIFPGAPEVCNGRDDNCTGGTDETPLSGAPTISGTTFMCEDGAWDVDQCPVNVLHCDDNVNNGCETDGTSLADCGACDRECEFSCGGSGATRDCAEVSKLALGYNHSCAILETGKVSCWGLGSHGELGDGLKADASLPVMTSVLSNATELGAGDQHSCAIQGTAPGVLSCWGSDSAGQLGNGTVTTTEQAQPGVVWNGTIVDAKSVTLGDEHTCAIDEGTQNALWCWGNRSNGRTGVSFNTGTDAVPVRSWVNAGSGYRTFINVQAAEAGVLHTCALATGDVDGQGNVVSGGVFCAGDDSLAQNGNAGANALEQAFFPVAGLSGVVELAVGAYHNCVRHANGTVSCWGRNNKGQTGQALANTTVTTPTQVPGLTGVSKLYAQGNLSCAIADGVVKCWGENDYSQLGDPSATPGVVTTNTAPALSGVTHLALGYSHLCAQVGSLGAVYCWGRNQSGQLGLGSTDTSAHASPTQVSPLGN